MPPVPMTVRTAAKTDHIEGVLVPKGTVLFIPVRPHLHTWLYFNSCLLILQIRVVNTCKKTWGEDAEEYVWCSLLYFSN